MISTKSRRVKSSICFFIIFFLIFTLFPVVYSQEQQSYRAKKIVSVVYDDSGSMSYDNSANWAYANYAMQAYLALLDKDDDIYITYMSNPGVSVPYTELEKNRQGFVDEIRNHWGESYTPISAAETAYNTIMNVQDGGANTEYSLVIITDGSFDDGQNSIPNDQLNSLIAKYANTIMNNGSILNVTYFAIGGDAIIPNQTGNLTIYQADSSNLTNTLFSIADKTSGRYQFDAGNIGINGNTLTLKSDFPLLTVGILVQNLNSDIQSVTVTDNQQVSWEKVSLSAPNHEGATTDPNLKGSAFLIRNSSGNIPSGTMTIDFTEPVTTDTIRIMYEPALSLKLSVIREGKELTDFSNLRVEDEITIEPSFQELGTGKEIDANTLPKDMKTSLSYQYQGEQATTQDNLKPVNIKLKQKPLTIRASASLENVFNVERTVDINPKGPIVYEIKANIPEEMKNFQIRNIKENTSSIDFYITADGQPISADEARDMPFDVTLSKDVPYELTFDEATGHHNFKIVYKWPLWFRVPSGELTITASTLNNVSSETKINLVPAPLWYLLWNLMFPIISISLGLILIFLYIRKRRFRRGSYLMTEEFRSDHAGYIKLTIAKDTAREVKLSKFSIWSLLPVSNRVKIQNVTFFPGSSGNTIYAKISKNNMDNWYKGGSFETDDLPNSKIEYQLPKPTDDDKVKPDKKGMVQLSINNCLITPYGRGRYTVYYYYRKK